MGLGVVEGTLVKLEERERSVYWRMGEKEKQRERERERDAGLVEPESKEAIQFGTRELGSRTRCACIQYSCMQGIKFGGNISIDTLGFQATTGYVRNDGIYMRIVILQDARTRRATVPTACGKGRRKKKRETRDIFVTWKEKERLMNGTGTRRQVCPSLGRRAIMEPHRRAFCSKIPSLSLSSLLLLLSFILPAIFLSDGAQRFHPPG